MGIVVVVEDGVGAPLASLLGGRSRSVTGASWVAGQRDLVDLEELELSLVDLGAVAVTGSEVGGSPAMVGTVPALLTTFALAGVVPVEGNLRAGRSLSGVRGRFGVLVGDDVGLVDRGTHYGLVAPTLVGLPGRRVGWERIIDVGAVEALVRLAANLGTLNGSVARD